MSTEYDPNYVFEPAPFLLGVKAALYNTSGEVLLIKRSAKSSRAGGWDLPGGTVDKGEDPHYSAIREIQEETAMTVPDLTLLNTQHISAYDKDIIIIGYTGHVASDAVTLSWEHDAFEWVSMDDLAQYGVPKSLNTIIEASS